MLYYGEAYMLQYLSSETVVYNITSFKEGLVKLNLLPPIDRRLCRDGGRDFDMYYAQWILCNDNIFFDFFRIIFDLYMARDVYLVMDSQDWSENILESLLKLIQQRYGYNAAYIDSFEAYIYAQNNMISQFEPTYGLMNLDQDKDRYSIILARMNPNNLKCGIED